MFLSLLNRAPVVGMHTIEHDDNARALQVPDVTSYTP